MIGKQCPNCNRMKIYQSHCRAKDSIGYCLYCKMETGKEHKTFLRYLTKRELEKMLLLQRNEILNEVNKSLPDDDKNNIHFCKHSFRD